MKIDEHIFLEEYHDFESRRRSEPNLTQERTDIAWRKHIFEYFHVSKR